MSASDQASSQEIEFSGSSSALPADLVRALVWLRSHLPEPVRLDTLALIAGVRPRTLETHFRLFLGTTPLGWVRRARLARARQQLLNAGPQDTVTNIALASGFNQLGRFAGVYRKNFGEHPSTTIERTRKSSSRVDLGFDEAIRLTMEALPLAFAVAPAQCDEAIEKLDRPQELAPSYALPKAIAAWCWGQRAAHRFSATPDTDRAKAYQLQEQALVLDPHDPMTLTLSSGALVLLHRLDDAETRLERALALDPWLAYAWIRRGWMSAYVGDSDLRELRIALYLMPFEPLRHITFIGIGCTHFLAERYEQAARWVLGGVEASPGSYWADRVAVAAAALAGARSEARRRARNLMRNDPDLTVAEARQAWPFTPGFMARLGDGLEIAGVPRA
jgi:AraC-like DNA-binding protein